MTPSTSWKETQPPGEADVFERLAQDLAAMQSGLARKTGTPARALHAKPNVAARARFEVHEVPEDLRVGLFAAPKTYDAVVRFSNGGPSRLPDRKPDVRGIAVKVLGVAGKKLIPGLEDAPTQDFLAILSAAVPFRTPEEFVWVVTNAQSPLTFLPKALVHLGPGRALKLLSALQKGLGAPVQALHTNRYFSALPIRFGAHAAKYRFEPLDVTPEAGADDTGAQLAAKLASAPLRWAFEVQRYVDDATTPIEDPTVEWSSPWSRLATLTLPQQQADAAFTAWVEPLSFDPWHALEEFRPLGAMMRARNAAYRVSTQARKAAAEPGALP